MSLIEAWAKEFRTLVKFLKNLPPKTIAPVT